MVQGQAYYPNKAPNQNTMEKPYIQPNSTTGGQNYTKQVYVPPNEKLLYQYPCQIEDSTSLKTGYNDDNSTTGFVNRTYLYPKNDFSTHCDVTLQQVESWQANYVVAADKIIQPLPPTAFASPDNYQKIKDDMHDKLMKAYGLIYHGHYNLARVQLQEIKTKIGGNHLTSESTVTSLITDPEAQKKLLPLVDDLIAITINSSSTGSQLPTVTTPEYGPIVEMVLAIAIISILAVSTKNKLGFKPT